MIIVDDDKICGKLKSIPQDQLFRVNSHRLVFFNHRMKNKKMDVSGEVNTGYVTLAEDIQ